VVAWKAIKSQHTFHQSLNWLFALVSGGSVHWTNRLLKDLICVFYKSFYCFLGKYSELWTIGDSGKSSEKTWRSKIFQLSCPLHFFLRSHICPAPWCDNLAVYWYARRTGNNWIYKEYLHNIQTSSLPILFYYPTNHPPPSNGENCKIKQNIQFVKEVENHHKEFRGSFLQSHLKSGFYSLLTLKFQWNQKD